MMFPYDKPKTIVPALADIVCAMRLSYRYMVDTSVLWVVGVLLLQIQTFGEAPSEAKCELSLC